MASFSERARAEHAQTAVAAEAAMLAYVNEVDTFHDYLDDKSYPDTPIWIGRRQISGQPDVFYGRALLPVPPARVFEIMEDKGRRLDWDPTWLKDEFRVLHEHVDGDATYDIYYEPHSAMLGGFISAREILNVRLVRRLPDGGLTQAFTSIVDESVEVKPGYVRAFCMHSGILSKPAPDGKTEIHYVIQVDPRGRIPTWASARATAGTVVGIIKHILLVANEQ